MAITKIGTPELFDFSATNTALQLPTGDTASRPSAPSTGEWRYNSELKYVEYWDGGSPGAWRQIDTEAPANPDDFPSQNFNVNTYFGTGAIQTIDAKFNEAANFNGSSSKIRLPDNSFNSLTSYTVSAFVNVSSTSNNQTIFSNWGYNGSTEKGWIVGLLNGTQVRVFNIKNGTVQTFNSTASAISLNTWTNISITNTQSEIKIYINGSLDITHSTNGFDFDASYPMIPNIGAYQYSSGIFGYFNGKIDQVRIYNSALDQAAVTALQLETTTTASSLSFPSGETAIATYQLDGNGNDIPSTQTATTVATYQLNGPTLVPSIPGNTYPGTPSNITFVAGKFGDAAAFNGSNSKITISDISPKSISMWVNLDTLDRYDALIGNSSNTSNYIYWADSSESYQLRLGNLLFGSGTAKNTVGVVGSWVNVVFIDNGSGLVTCYIDGSSVGVVSASLSTYNEIGARTAGGDQWLDGKLDQVRLFDTALPQSAVTSLYNETVATSSSASISYQYGTYNGTTTDIGYTGLKFQPDFVWIKARVTAYSHRLFDSVRTLNGRLESNNTSAEVSNTVNDNFVSFNSNGFTLGATSSTNGSNFNNEPFVAWNWKAGGAPTATNSQAAGAAPTPDSVLIDGVSSTAALAGTLPAKNISANTAAGFSIVKYTANATSGATIGTGLDQELDLLIVKSTNLSQAWNVYVKDVTDTSSKYLRLNEDLGIPDLITANPRFIPNNFTDSVFSVGNDNATNGISGTDQYIAYCFHSVAGYQKVGSYTGNGGTLLVTTGFAPRFVMLKPSSLADNWMIYDTSRGKDIVLFPNLFNGDTTYAGRFSFLSDGFQLSTSNSGWNGSGSTYIYLAIAADK